MLSRSIEWWRAQQATDDAVLQASWSVLVHRASPPQAYLKLQISVLARAMPASLLPNDVKRLRALSLRGLANDASCVEAARMILRLAMHPAWYIDVQGVKECARAVAVYAAGYGVHVDGDLVRVLVVCNNMHKCSLTDACDVVLACMGGAATKECMRLLHVVLLNHASASLPTACKRALARALSLCTDDALTSATATNLVERAFRENIVGLHETVRLAPRVLRYAQVPCTAIRALQQIVRHKCELMPHQLRYLCDWHGDLWAASTLLVLRSAHDRALRVLLRALPAQEAQDAIAHALDAAGVNLFNAPRTYEIGFAETSRSRPRLFAPAIDDVAADIGVTQGEVCVFKVHRTVLMTSSVTDHFKIMFEKSIWRETRDMRLFLPDDIDVGAARVAFEFMYSGEWAELRTSTLEQQLTVYTCARYFSVGQLMRDCVAAWCDMLKRDEILPNHVMEQLCTFSLDAYFADQFAWSAPHAHVLRQRLVRDMLHNASAWTPGSTHEAQLDALKWLKLELQKFVRAEN